MDGDGPGFTFPPEFTKGPESTDISWGDMFLDGIHSDDPNSADAGAVAIDGPSIGNTIHGTAPMVQQQPNVIGGQLQVHIPAHFQGTLGNNTVQQVSSGTVTYLAPSGTSHVSTAGRLQHVLPATGQQVTAPVGQTQNNAKLVQIAPSFPMASQVQQLNSVPIQTLLQSNQTLTGQTLYGNQGTSLFPAQGSVHIENPKVVNVNFGPHVIGSDGSGQQAIIQTAEGKRVLITNSQLQHMPQYFAPQSISLSQLPVGAHLINPGTGNVIRASMTPGTTQTRQIVLPTGQTVIPRQANAQQAGLTKNVVLNHHGMSPLIYQSGQGGQIIQTHPTLITSSGTGLQVVNTGGTQGNQVQLITQPSMNQSGMGQQINQNTIMNFINNQSVIPNASGQITGLVPGQNIFVNGQMLNIGQIGGLTMSQLQVQPNTQGGVTLANLNTGVARQAQFQPTTQHLLIQSGGQQQIMLQQKNTSSPSLITTTTQRLNSNIQGGKIARTPTPNANSASSTPVATPTPSTPTPTPTPDLMSEYGGQGSKISSIIEQALEMSDIDLQSFEDDFFENTTASLPQTELTPPVVKSKPQPPVKTKSKSAKSKSKPVQPLVNVSVPNSTISFQNSKAIFQNAQGQKVTISPDQQIITAAGQVYVLSANGQQLILQHSVAQQVKPIAAPTSTSTSAVANVSISSSNQKQSAVSQSNLSGGGQIRLNQGIPVQFNQNQNSMVLSSPREDSNQMFTTNHQEESGLVSSTVQTPLVSSSHLVYSRPSSYTFTTSNITQSGSNQIQLKNQKITTLQGTFIKQEPCVTPVKQESFVDTVKQELITDTSTSQALTQQMQYSPIAVVTTSNMTTSLPTGIMSSVSPHADPSTTQAHQTIIMSSSHVSNTQQTPLVPTSVQLPRSSSVSCETSTVFTTAVFSQALSSPTFSTSSKTNSASKERDPNSIKVMTPIKIANSTLMLSLTPLQKKRLEDHLSSMSMKEQNDFLAHQQNIIRRSQQVQQKQLEQQQKYQLQQKQHLQQQQIQQQLPPQQPQHQPQTNQQQQSVQNLSSPRLASTTTEYNLPTSGSQLASIPSTVQELMDKPEECQTQSSFPDQQQQQFRHQIPVSQTSTQPTSIQQMRLVPEPLMVTPVQNYTFQPTGRCLAEQQLLRDKTLALNPDVNSPFKSFSDAMRRLVRYHTLQDHKPEEGSKQMRKWDTRYSTYCDYLVKKKRHYMKRFNKMKLHYDMCPEKSPEYLQNLYCFNEQLQELLNREKEEAKNSPETFEPLQPGLHLQSSNVQPPIVASTLTGFEHETIDECKSHLETKEEIKFDYKLEHPEVDIKSERSNSPYSSPSGLKRKLPEKSTGTLKLVFKRRTTDNFIVKNSLSLQDDLPQNFKPVVNLEKSDSEYEFDSTVSNKQSVTVKKRRASSISLTSRQTSFEANSEHSSSNSPNNKVSRRLSSDETSQSEEEEDDDNEDEEKNSDDAVNSFSEEDVEDEDSGSQEEKTHSRTSYRVTFGATTNNHDAFMESLECKAAHSYKHDSSLSRTNTIVYTGEKVSGLKKSSQASSRSVSYSNTNCGLSNNNYSVDKRVPSSNQFTYSVSEAQSAFQQSALQVSPPRRKDCVPGSPGSIIEKGPERGLPIFTTPNKNLLQTDAMFNFSEDEDDESDRCRRISSFEIDNKDPQNSMMNDSVRSAINSVLNDGDNEDSQTSWSSSAHRTPSSVHHSLFQPSSPAIVQSHDTDLDTAVQSIMNN